VLHAFDFWANPAVLYKIVVGGRVPAYVELEIGAR
jgi:hypothetical protein